MTTHRRPEIPFTGAAWGTCRWCGEAIQFDSGENAGEINKRRRWHQECVDIYNASDPREARRRIRKRDRGRCASCDVDTYKVRRELMKLARGRARAIREQGYKPGKSFWELDHIVPLIDEGSHADENLQTLCTPCHTQKTALEARERATRNRPAATERDTEPVVEDTLEPQFVRETIGEPGLEIEIVTSAEHRETDRAEDSQTKSRANPSSSSANTSSSEAATDTTTKPVAESSSPAKADFAQRKKPPTLDELLEAADEVNARVRRVLQDPPTS